MNHPPSQQSADNSVEDRLTELEVKAGLAEDLLEEINRTVYRQQQQIEQLRQEVRALRQQLEATMPGERHSPGDEVPPHY